MANKVSFIIQLKDQFGRTARKVNQLFGQIKTSADKASRSVQSFAKKSRKSLGDLGRGMRNTGAVMTAAVTLPLALMGKAMIGAASDADEVATKFDQVFRSLTNAGTAATSLASKYKLAASSSKEMISTSGAMIASTGLESARVLELSKSMAGASIDLASFHNFKGSATDASLILTKALLGEAESLKTNFEIQISQGKHFQDSVKQKMRLSRISEKAAKAEVIYAEIMRQAGEKGQGALGDFNRTIDGYANQSRVAAEAAKEMSESFGKLILPMATKVVSALSKVAGWVNNLSPAMKGVVLVVGGFLAIAGPLLLVLGGIAIAVAAITWPIALVAAGIAGLIVLGAALAANWDKITRFASEKWIAFSDVIGGTIEQIGINFGLLWDGITDGLKSFVNFGIKMINSLLAPLNFVAEKLGLGSVKITAIGAATVDVPVIDAPKVVVDVPVIDVPIVPALKLVAPTTNRRAGRMRGKSAPTAPVGAPIGTINGNILVEAAPGTKVKQTKLKAAGNGYNMGVNMTGAL